MGGKNEGLRNYQQEMRDRIFAEWEYCRSVMVQMPTGTGKTHLLAAVVREFLYRPEARVWIVVHRRELVEQIEETVARYGMDKEEGTVSVLSVQWLSRNWTKTGCAPDLVVIDEAHHAPAETYKEIWKRCPEAKKLGVTATPCRLNRKGFTDLFDVLVTSWSVAEFIGAGWLSAFDYVSIRANSKEQQLIDALKKRGADGDFQVKEMDKVLNRPAGIGKLYESVGRYAHGKKGIVYAVSIAHARRIAAYYSRHGMEAVAIDSKMPLADRKRMVEEFRQGRIRVLVNVDIFSEGFDCPDVEFVQLARPTLSLAKYLQQVGRGLRKTCGKETCMLIDNVGLYRIFGLPVGNRDWKAMFEGRLVGGALSQAGAGAGRSLPAAVLPEDGERDEELEVVMTHGQLLEAIRNGTATVWGESTQTHAGMELRAWHDRHTGLWGLRRGDRMTVMPCFDEVFDLGEERAAVRFANGRAGVVDASGKAVMMLADDCRRLRLLKGELLDAELEGGTHCYTDLRTGRGYRERPVVCSYGSVELLRAGGIFYSRTRKGYASTDGLHKDSLCFYDFYLKIPDHRVPRGCRLADPVWSTVFDVFACVLEGDDEEVYWCCGRLADRSIVVMDSEGKYYHAERGKEKRYVAGNSPRPGEADFCTVMERLREEAGRRAEAADRQRLLAREEKRRRRLEAMKDVEPFCMGTKWGLKWGGRIVVPPCYRKILSPVGDYCAFEENACQWGVMALDGKVVVEARYQAVDLDADGTARLTVIPGKVKTVKL